MSCTSRNTSLALALGMALTVGRAGTSAAEK